MKVSIIIPTYNYGHYIQQAIESVLQQDYPSELTEVIVIDDGSTDNTKEVLQEISRKAPNVQYHYQENAGKAAATQIGIALANGELIFNLDADDWFLPGKISNTVAMFAGNFGLVHVATPALIHYDDGSRTDTIEPVPSKLLGRPSRGHYLLRYFMEHKLLFGGGSTFAAKASVLKAMAWNPAVDMYTDEWLLIETLLKGDCYLLPEPLSVWRVHGGNYSGSQQAAPEIKQERLRKSSAAILQLLETGAYPDWLQKTYRLKHATREIVWLEERNKKTPADIARYVSRGIFSGNSFSTLNAYHAFNRLVPGWVKRNF